MPESIYLDHAASTRVRDDVIALLTDVLRTAWGNPSALHPQGAAARAHLAAARERLLAAVGGAGADEVIWTSGCTEADALAVLGAARARRAATGRPGRVVLSTVEHAAVAEAAAALAAEGHDIVAVAPGPDAILDPEAVAEAAAGGGGGGAAVVAVVMVQNDLGAVQPVAAIAAAVRRRAPACHVHVDAAQAVGKVPVDAGALRADSLAIAGHKLGAPKGVGALWLRAGAAIAPLWVGGGQQGGRRGGTQDAAGAAALALAVDRAVADRPAAQVRWLALAARVRAAVGARARQLVPDDQRAPHILALGVPGVPAAALRAVLVSRGVYISTGSACAERDAKPSPALAAIGLPAGTGMARLSFGADTTEADVDRAAALLAQVAGELAGAAP
jgi:cysteine desulfurase